MPGSGCAIRQGLGNAPRCACDRNVGNVRRYPTVGGLTGPVVFQRMNSTYLPVTSGAAFNGTSCKEGTSDFNIYRP